MMKPWRLALSFVIVFLLGGAVGGLVSMRMMHRMLFSPPRAEEMAREIVGRLQNDLDLAPEQVAKIKPIVAQMTKEMSATQKEMIDRMTETRNKGGSKISDVLSGEQKKKFDASEAKRREFMREH